MNPLQVGDPGHIGPFRILGRLGEGGMGVVYLGSSPGGRRVAIKVIHPRHASDPDFRRRFAREVAAARRVGGFHTALVVDADPDAEPPWMATAFIRGSSLADVVARQGALGQAEVHALGSALAEGLAAIHACGLIHRDLKPGNIILAEDGPRIIDFGIAKSGDITGLTGAGVIIGTPGYMSPEQLKAQEATVASDVFALGVILAYTATGRHPFEAPTDAAVMYRVVNDAPTLGQLTGVLRDLLTACLAKDPGARPHPAQILNQLSVADGMPGTVDVAAAPGGTTSVPVAPDSPSASARQDPAPFRETPVPSPGAEPPSGVAPARWRAALVVAVVAAAGLAILFTLPSGNSPAAVNRPAVSKAATAPSASPRHTASPRPPGPIVATATSLHTFRDFPSGEGFSGAFDPASGLLAIGGSPSIADLTGPARVSLWNVATRTLATNLDTDGTVVIAETFAPGGRILAAADNDGDTYLWNISARKIITIFPSHLHGSALAVAFSPDGKTLAVAHSNGTVELWSVATGTQIDVLQIPAGAYPQVTSVAFSPDGKILAAGTLDENEAGSTYLWSTATYRIIATLNDPGGAGTTALAFWPGGAILAVGDHDATTYLWNVATRKVAATLDDSGGISIAALTFTPNSRALVAFDGGGTAYVWSTATKRVTATLTCPGGSGNWVAISANGAILASGTSSTTCLWKLSYRATLFAAIAAAQTLPRPSLLSAAPVGEH